MSSDSTVAFITDQSAHYSLSLRFVICRPQIMLKPDELYARRSVTYRTGLAPAYQRKSAAIA